MADKSLFETVLASTVHDLKNSLSLLMGELDNVTLKLDSDAESKQAVSSIRYESSRLNHSLMQLLTLYKLDNNQLAIQLSEVEVIDFIEDCVAAHTPLAAIKGIQLKLNCDDSLVWFFDQNMISIAINNIIGNSIRYSKSCILITVKIVEGRLLIQVDDDGEGYPQNMIKDPENFIKQINHSTGSTGLGLFFSSTVAQCHNRSGKQGSIELENDQLLSGGCFRIYLP